MRVSCIIPAYNEESTLGKVLRVVKKVRTIHEIIVVDDGSSDKTYAVAKAEDVRVIRHPENRGKGAAIKTGYQYSKGNILLFLDADVTTFAPQQLTAVLRPIQNGYADFVKTSFSRSRGRVTELVVKPLFNILSPLLHLHFNQPLSGQFAIKRNLMKNMKIDDRWGVDIQILLQSVKKGIRIAEVDIGGLEHKHQPIQDLAKMSEDVMRTILSELGILAHKHKLIIFDLDKTIMKQRSMEFIANEWGFYRAFQRLQQYQKEGKITQRSLQAKLASLFRGKTMADIQTTCLKLHMQDHIVKVVEHLQKRQYQIAVISLVFKPLVDFFAEKLSIDKKNIFAPDLISNDEGVYTGELTTPADADPSCCDALMCKTGAGKMLMKRLHIQPEECVVVWDGKSEMCLSRTCGLSLAYKPPVPCGDITITNPAEILIYAE